tara:strand:+ start:3741 stop:3935 length:195 start_codon:yes stop_codon:yes gene_type:complete
VSEVDSALVLSLERNGRLLLVQPNAKPFQFMLNQVWEEIREKKKEIRRKEIHIRTCEESNLNCS